MLSKHGVASVLGLEFFKARMGLRCLIPLILMKFEHLAPLKSYENPYPVSWAWIINRVRTHSMNTIFQEEKTLSKYGPFKKTIINEKM